MKISTKELYADMMIAKAMGRSAEVVNELRIKYKLAQLQNSLMDWENAKGKKVSQEEIDFITNQIINQ